MASQRGNAQTNTGPGTREGTDARRRKENRKKGKRKREEVGGEKQKPTWPERGTGHEASFDDYMYIHVFSD